MGGRRKSHHHRWFTTEYGHPKLREHLAGVMALMRAAPYWSTFERSLKRAYKKPGETTPIPFSEE